MDKDYIQGMEDGVLLVKQLFELSQVERVNKFGSRNVADILDKFDFTQIKEIMTVKEVCNIYYVIRAYVDNIMIDESGKMKFHPTIDIIHDYMKRKPDAEYCRVVTIYVREKE